MAGATTQSFISGAFISGYFDAGVYGSLLAALTAANAAGGGTVSIPPGTTFYYGTSPLETSAPILFVGAGSGASILVFAGGPSGYLWLNTAGSAVRDVTLQRGDNDVSRLLFVTAAGCRVDSARFDGQGHTWAGTALSVGIGGNYTIISKNAFAVVNGTDISATGCNGLTIEANQFTGHLSSFSPVSLNSNVTQFVISNNTIICDPASSGTAIAMNTSVSGDALAGGTVSGNYIETANFGIEIHKTASGSTPTSVCVSGNTIRAVAGSFGGISISGANSITAAGNVIDANSLTLATMLEVTDAEYCTVSTNTLTNGLGVAAPITLNGASHNTMSGNVINGFLDAAGSAGMQLSASATAGATKATDNIVTGNHIVFPATTAGNLETGISLVCNAASAFVDRNVIVGNSVVGNGVANSRGIQLNANGTGGSVADNLVGMNVVSGCAVDLYQNGDTGTLTGGTVWDQLV